jgi:phosphate-selective porin OprO and OprP
MQLALAALLVSATTTATTADTGAFRVGFKLGDGFLIEQPNALLLNIRTRGQFLYTIENNDLSTAPPTLLGTTTSLQFRRLRVTFSGYVFGKQNVYRMELGFSPRDIAVRNNVARQTPLIDYYFRFTHLRDLTLQVGQYRVPFDRERMTSAGNLNMVDRSILNDEFTLERDLGFDLRSNDLFGLGFLRYYAGVFIGEGRNTFELSDFGLNYIVRLEVLPLGLYDDSSLGDLPRTPSPKLTFGVGYGYLDRAKRDQGILGIIPVDLGTTNFHLATADAYFVWRGLSILGAFFFRNGERNIPLNTIEFDRPRNAYGFMLQPAYLLPWIDLEIEARFDRIVPYGETLVTLRSDLGVGLSYYFVGHSMKLQADFFHQWLTNDLANSNNIFRLQLQTAF